MVPERRLCIELSPMSVLSRRIHSMTNKLFARSMRSAVARNRTAIWPTSERVRRVCRPELRTVSGVSCRMLCRCSRRKCDDLLMPDEAEKLIIQVTDKEASSALVYPADKKNRAGLTVLLGHGAGANQVSGFMRMFAKGLAARGLDVVTFNFIYMEQGRSVPDQKPKLEACFRAVIEGALKHKKLKKNRL